jgi:REP element-mobilizing transposase RayT
VQHVVFGLADAFSDESGPEDARARLSWRDEMLDQGLGAKLLKGEAASLVERALLHFDGERYRLFAWCVMPNHVHVLLQQLPGSPLDQAVHSWKSYTANAINKVYGRSGRLWRREYFDHFMRDDFELSKTRTYIEDNPVKAGLVERANLWRWSSAWDGREA